MNVVTNTRDISDMKLSNPNTASSTLSEMDRSSENNSCSVKFSLDKTNAQAVGSPSSSQPEK